MPTATVNVHEQSAREKKARALLLHIDAALSNVGIDPVRDGLRMVRGFTSTEWRAFARRAEVNEPSAATQAVVLDLFAKREQVAAEVEALEELAADLEETDLGDEAARAATELRREHDDGLHAYGADR